MTDARQMLLILVVLSLTRQLTGLPVSNPPWPSSFLPRATSSPAGVPCKDPSGRSLWDIVWSCLATIFACTWFALHPNIPSPTDSGWSVFKRGLATISCALIAPELMATWALHQYLGARQIRRKYNTEILQLPEDGPRPSVFRRFFKYAKGWFRVKEIKGPGEKVRWTKTHGFFMQMGGFMLYKNGEPVKVLTYNDLKDLCHRGKVDIPHITERTINDKSKSDYLSKGVVVVQTTWFIIQCTARWISGLPLAELEVVTLAFAILNAITYFLWLNKPQNVQESIRIHLKTDDTNDEDYKPEESDAGSFTTAVSTHEQKGWLHRHLVKDFENSKEKWGGVVWFVLFCIPYRIITGALHPMKKLFLYSDSSHYHPTRLRVPMFSKEKLDNPSLALMHHLPCLIGAFFGLVHVIAWWSGPTVIEQWLWRYSTLVIIIEPLLFAIAKGMTSHPWEYSTHYWFLGIIRDILIFFISFPLIVGLPAYVIARVILITQALASLRHLPDGTFCAIDWDSFIPHL